MIARTTRWLGALALPFAALPAFAAEGGLEIFPDFSPTGRLVQLIVLFLLTIYPANKLLFQPLLSMLDERDGRIAGARKKAAEVGSRADEVLARYEEGLARARKEAEGLRREQLESAREEQASVTREARGLAEQEVAEARSQVAGAIDEARGALHSESGALARDVAAQVLGRPLA
jgi:F-type H+-transporting ATPase subunit b